MTHHIIRRFVWSYLLCFLLGLSWLQATPQSPLIISTNANGSLNVKRTHVLHEQELELIQLIAQHPLQKRSAIYLDPALTVYANVKVDDLANRQYFAHQDDQGHLITYYFGGALNSLAIAGENLAAGYGNAATTVQAWENSTSGHRESMLGLPRNGVADPLYPYFGVGFARVNISGDKFGGLYWATENSFNPGAVQGLASDPKAFQATSDFKLLMPDGVTPVNIYWNWITAEIAGIERVHVENDATYTSSWIGHFKNLGGMFFTADATGFTYSQPDRITGAKHFFISHQGWFWTTPEMAPFYWSRNRGNWVYVDIPGKRIHDYNNHLWEDWTPDGPYVRILSDKRQTYVGQPVVIAWDADNQSQSIQFWSSQTEANGNPSYYSTARKGAILWHPPAPGEYVFAIRRKTGNQVEAKHVTISVIPHPVSNAIAQISTSKTEVNINEVYTVSWNSTGGIPIVRSSPGISPNTIDGVFSNEAAGSAQFTQQAPGVYTYTIQHGALSQQVNVTVVGSLATPTRP